MALILRNGGSQSPDRWLREPRNNQENDEKLFDQYVLGGVDILYEKLIESATSTEDYLKNLYDFMEDMDDRYNQTIDSDQISSLCRLAKK